MSSIALESVGVLDCALVECVELMLAANNLTASYAEAMLIATSPDHLVEVKKTSRASAGVTQEQMAKMEREVASVQRKY